jgi:signal transduction histidine kinase
MNRAGTPTVEGKSLVVRSGKSLRELQRKIPTRTAGTAFAFQEHMFGGRNDLQQAVNELREAEPDKGGHRDAAINLAQQVTEQVNLGIEYAAGNPP